MSRFQLSSYSAAPNFSYPDYSSMSLSGIQGQPLEVTVVGCNKLKDTEWFSRQDPYVCLEYANHKHRTRTCTDGGKNPTFQEKFVFPMIEGLRELNVLVWNSNTVTVDDFIGDGKVQLQKVISQGYDDSSWTLQTKTGRYAGEVRLIMHYAKNHKPTANYAPSAPPYGGPPQPNLYSTPHTAGPYGPYPPPPAAYPAPSPSPYPSYSPSSAGYSSSAYSAPSSAYPSTPYPPNSTYPPSTYPPSTYPPSTYPPSTYPPSSYPPSTYPPSTYPPSTYPLSSYPPPPQSAPFYPQSPFPGIYPPPPY